MKEAKETQAVVMREELRKMKKVLRQLGYISNSGVLSSKGPLLLRAQHS